MADLYQKYNLRRIINAHFRLGAATNAGALAAFASSTAPSGVRAEAVQLLGEWAKPSGRDNVSGLWRPLDKRDGRFRSQRQAPRAQLLRRSQVGRVRAGPHQVPV